MAVFDKISLALQTGENAFNGKVYLGFGGREFRLRKSGNNFRKNAREEFVLGQDSNVVNTVFNDPRAYFEATTQNIDRFPVYLRADGAGDWSIDDATIFAFAGGQQVSFKLEGAITLGGSSGRYAYFRRALLSTFNGTDATSLQLWVEDIGNINAAIDAFGVTNPLQTDFSGSVSFAENNSEVDFKLNDDDFATFLLVSQVGRSIGTFNLPTGRMEFDLRLRITFLASNLNPIRIEAEADFTMSTDEKQSTVEGSNMVGLPLNQQVGLITLVGTSTLESNGTLNNRNVDLRLSGLIGPFPQRRRRF